MCLASMEGVEFAYGVRRARTESMRRIRKANATTARREELRRSGLHGSLRKLRATKKNTSLDHLLEYNFVPQRNLMVLTTSADLKAKRSLV
mmetsp:Transcript_12360/g.37701  ORF Transcript_12360/g.37701 Transcript_12360/m.37701 type:complete len:91 (+) Transcript_12360:107-379(+)